MKDRDAALGMVFLSVSNFQARHWATGGVKEDLESSRIDRRAIDHLRQPYGIEVCISGDEHSRALLLLLVSGAADNVEPRGKVLWAQMAVIRVAEQKLGARFPYGKPENYI